MPFRAAVFVLARGSSGDKYQPPLTSIKAFTYISYIPDKTLVSFLVTVLCSAGEDVGKATPCSHLRARTRTRTPTHKFIHACMHAHIYAACHG